MSNALLGTKGVWYAIHVLPQNEFSVSRLLTNKFSIFSRVPSRKVWKLKNGKRVERIRPLLSSYVFINCNIQEINWRLFYSIKGIFGFVKHAGKPASIPEEQISTLEKLTECGNAVHEIDYSKLKENERVEVVDGPLKGAVGNYLKISEKTGKFVVRLEMFKRALVTELEEGCIKPF